MMRGENNNLKKEFEGGFNMYDPLNWLYPELQENGTLSLNHLPPTLSSFFPTNPNVLPLPHNTITAVTNNQVSFSRPETQNNTVFPFQSQLPPLSIAPSVFPSEPNLQDDQQQQPQEGTSSKSKSGKRWSEDEHSLFLIGLEKHGKGQWRNISRIIKTRTPSQVASHAQKFFLRLASRRQGKKRRSINDILIPDNRPPSLTTS